MTDQLAPVAIGDHLIGDGRPVYMIGEIGINHNGDVEIAKQLMDVAAAAGAQAVKFQKRNPDVAVPEHQKSKMRSTPWGEMTYLDYKHRVEFGREEYAEIDRYANELGLQWFASPWDVDSVEFLETEFDALTYKVASASLTDFELLRAIAATGKPVLCSSGMADWATLDAAVEVFDRDKLVLMHATSTYPLPPEEVNLAAIPAMRERYGVPVGYSGHELGLEISFAAAALGAATIERHITLDSSMWGSDQSASMEPREFTSLVKGVRVLEVARGDGTKRIMPGEESKIDSLRKVTV
ncbi:N-acetylneuraminate synthase [Brevibacterium sanguinis]|uniref:N-acetylneuraminate synthase n=2 Tax=Brevibacterium TaxID=1696 RepID=A0A366IQV6_9MICO|nr:MULTISPECIES: N-acetylneuraminate synthase family protein [Brevibacterium]RBP68233.1 N-acetylneuraminate synthase [Brevibacterium sanguinis]RBP74350.1 N-acetylneuraminate synthase [Brevibacterium celere]